jgi:hypothetical protein
VAEETIKDNWDQIREFGVEAVLFLQVQRGTEYRVLKIALGEDTGANRG